MRNIPVHGAHRANPRVTHPRIVFAKSALIVATMIMGSLASAAIVVETGNDSAGTYNVLANSCAPSLTTPGLTAQGCLSTDNSYLINFTSDESITYSGGQASIVAADDDFNFVTIALGVPDSTFNKVLLNIDAVDDGFVTFTDASGNVSSPWALTKNGRNKFVLSGEDFQSISVETTVGIGRLKQVRIGGFNQGTPNNPGTPYSPGIPDSPGATDNPSTPDDTGTTDNSVTPDDLTPVDNADASVPIPGTLLLLGLGTGLLGLREARDVLKNSKKQKSC